MGRYPDGFPHSMRKVRVNTEFKEAAMKASLFAMRSHQRMDFLEGLGKVRGRLRKQFVEKLLVIVLREDSNAIVRHEAAFILGSLHRNGKPLSIASIEALCERALHDPSSVVRHEAAESLGWIPEPRARKALEQLLLDSNEDVVETARICLGRREPLVQSLDLKRRVVPSG